MKKKSFKELIKTGQKLNICHGTETKHIEIRGFIDNAPVYRWKCKNNYVYIVDNMKYLKLLYDYDCLKIR